MFFVFWVGAELLESLRNLMCFDSSSYYDYYCFFAYCVLFVCLICVEMWLIRMNYLIIDFLDCFDRELE